MPHKEDDISYLLSQISEGNSSCFEKMYKRYFKKCYSIALYFVQSTSSAEDVLSDVFLTLWHKRENLKDVKDWDSYLFITTKNRPHAGRKVTQERYGRMYAASYPATA